MPSTLPNKPFHIPAWRRIGLKLKMPQVQTYSLDTVISEDISLKRKAVLLDCSDEKENKKTKTVIDNTHQKLHEFTTPNASTKKSVTFTPETKVEDGDSIKKLSNTWITQQKSLHQPNSLFKPHKALDIKIDEIILKKKRKELKKAKKKPKLKDNNASKQEKSQNNSEPTNKIPSFLSYLREYHESKETWKFKKNHQTHLLQHIFDKDRVPSGYAHLIYAYVRGLRGQVRTRLRDAAITVKVDDQEKGVGGFPSEILDPDMRQKEYEAAIADYLSTDNSSQIQQLGHEESFLSRFEDELMKGRIIRRIRAEMILVELASSPEGNREVSSEPAKDTNCGKMELKSNVVHKKVRRRKKRTAIIEDSSSDDSESDSDDDSIDSDIEKEKLSKSSSCSSSSSTSSSDSD
ncbi:hypothetical protein HI914_03669 [Erysiphe necator]|nr:hypothetical protein HI914_03669 [Erysiphe necator]